LFFAGYIAITHLLGLSRPTHKFDRYINKAGSLYTFPSNISTMSGKQDWISKEQPEKLSYLL